MSSRTLVPTYFSIGSHQYGEPNEIVYGPDRRVVRPHCRRWAEDVSCPRLDLTAANTTCLPLNSSTRDGRTVRHPDEAKHPFVSSTPGLWRWRNLHGLRAPLEGRHSRAARLRIVTRSAGRGSSGSSTRARSGRGCHRTAWRRRGEPVPRNGRDRPECSTAAGSSRWPNIASSFGTRVKGRAGRGCGRRFLPQGVPRPGDG